MMAASSSSYFIDIENGAELARLIEQDQIITEQTGLFPVPINNLFPLRGEEENHVLDLACGPGGWALEAAYRVPELDVIGVDISKSMVSYAIMRAQMQGTTNASFEMMDITRPLAFPDASFSYIHARFLVGLMRPDAWIPLLQECKRILVPGGILCLTEAEWPMTNSLAYETLKRLVARALWVAKQSLSPDGQDFGITPMLSRFLREAGYEDIQYKATAIEWSAETALNSASYYQCQAAFALLRPFVLKMEVTTEQAFDILYEQMLNDICSASFCGMVSPLTVWGKVSAGDANVR